MQYLLSHIAKIIEAESAIAADLPIEQLLLDSRKVHSPAVSLFFALKGPRRDGHYFIPELYKKGIRNFVVSEEVETDYPDASFLLVPDTLAALQALAAYHRQQFNIPVIAVTGSNGKTIVKEWLYQLLHEGHHIVRSPKSYNSQTGVPLSVWQMNEQHDLAIFEAGISERGEMEKLEAIIRPGFGVLTNIGEAHSEGFDSFTEKLLEKIKLFKQCKQVVYCRDNSAQLDPENGDKKFFRNDALFYSWSRLEKAWLQVSSVEKQTGHTLITAQNKGREIRFRIPFTDDASVQNAITCCCVLLAMDMDAATIAIRMETLLPVNMRLVFNKGINHCSVINDSYSADLSSLEIALNFLDQQSVGTKKTVILSDFLQSALPDEELYPSIVANLRRHGVRRLIGIGERISRNLEITGEMEIELYASTTAFTAQFRSSQFKEETILVKGARVFTFEKIVRLLEQKVHETVLEVNLNAIVHNLKEYQKLLQPTTKIMAMVKAFAYGSGGAEIAGILQYHKVDYLGVAYADEGVELRKAGIAVPIMVMNPEAGAFETMVEYNLEPELFSFDLLHAFDGYLKREGLQQYPVHIEIETGMNRLGFAMNEIEELSDVLQATDSFKVQSVFSHLAASEDPQQDAFTLDQFRQFEKAALQLEGKLHYSFIRHIANSAATVRLSQLQLDMVRLGIGLYGIDSAATHQLKLETVATLKSTIAQVKKIKAGETVSYNRNGIVSRDSVIATVRIGYADGYPRRLGNGLGKMGVQTNLPDRPFQQVPVIGTVCMDMTMIDVTDIPGISEGDEVIIFGNQLPVQLLAQWAGTIPYEIMTSVSQRVKRLYFEE